MFEASCHIVKCLDEADIEVLACARKFSLRVRLRRIFNTETLQYR